MPLPIPDKPGQLFNNADSFAMVFDSAWRKLQSAGTGAELGPEQAQELRKQQALEACADHPFVLSNPAMAAQVADFRIRLLGL